MATAGGSEIGFLKVSENFFGAIEHRLRNAGQARDLNAVTLICGTFHNLPEEHHGIVVLAHGDVQVEHARQAVGEFGKFMVVRGEQGFGTELLMEMFHDRPRETEAIEGAGAAADFIEDHQALAGGVMENIGCLAHLDHESGLTAREIVAGADAREDAVEQIHPRLGGRHKAAGVREERD